MFPCLVRRSSILNKPYLFLLKISPILRSYSMLFHHLKFGPSLSGVLFPIGKNGKGQTSINLRVFRLLMASQKFRCVQIFDIGNAHKLSSLKL